jgi:ribonuclease VapC
MPETSVVLDSHALLQLFRNESGAHVVAGILEAAIEHGRAVHMTEVNYAEVQYMIRRKDGEAAWRQIAEELTSAPIHFHSITRALADYAADFKTRHRLSLADAFAAALAKLHKAQLVTGDPEFKALEKEIEIRWLS